MSRQTHHTCIRMSEKEYPRLKCRSSATGLSANAWLMVELARNFNSGYGTADELRFAVERLAQVVERFQALRKEGYPRAV